MPLGGDSPPTAYLAEISALASLGGRYFTPGPGPAPKPKDLTPISIMLGDIFKPV